MNSLVHGGDWAGFQLEYGAPPLDFSSNVSPLGVPAGVRDAVAEAVCTADRYPDPLCRAVRRAIAGAERVPADWCLCGNGSADLIFRAVLARRPQRALVTAPTFGEYGAALALVGCRVEQYPLGEENGFVLREDFLDAITPETDMVFLCEPNNPTGRTTPGPLLRTVLDRCGETGALLIVDECFGGFLTDPAAHTLKGLLGDYPNLLLLKAFTKLYALAGLRLGYCLCADGLLLDAMRTSGQPWAVSTPAQAAGVAALAGLGFRVIPGEANYLLFRTPLSLLEPLRRRGILLRGCGNYCGLDGSWYRTAVRTGEENRRLAAALTEIVKEGN